MFSDPALGARLDPLNAAPDPPRTYPDMSVYLDLVI